MSDGLLIWIIPVFPREGCGLRLLLLFEGYERIIVVVLEKILYFWQEKFNQNFMELDKNDIATGNTKEDKKQRKQFIINFYGKWIIDNPTKRLYNKSLEAFIEVRFLSLEETAQHASTIYKSTVAVTFLSEIIENAIAPKDKKGNIITEIPKANVKNQSRFSKLFIGLGRVNASKNKKIQTINNLCGALLITF